MSEPIPPSLSSNSESAEPEIDKVLYEAWATLINYDETASHLKRTFILRRQWVLILILISSLLSILISILIPGPATTILAIVSIVLPLTGTYIMTDVRRFIGTTAWIKYRYATETIRKHIFLYRANAGSYKEVGKEDGLDQNDRLAQELKNARATLHEKDLIPPVNERLREESRILAAITKLHEDNQKTNPSGDKLPADDGLSKINLDNYIEWRLNHQRKWYDSNGSRDFERMKRYVRLAQVFLLLGTVVSALTGILNTDLVLLVAATNSVAAFFTTWADVALYGKTYSIYRMTTEMLDDDIGIWEAKKNNTDFEKNKAQYESNFIERIETILQWERDEWFEQALQAQARSEQEILGNLDRLSKRGTDEQNKVPFDKDIGSQSNSRTLTAD